MPEIQEYQAPNGMVDFPFLYLYDASALTDGQSVQNIQVQLAGDSDFVLRRVVGMNNVLATAGDGGKWNLRNASQSYVTSTPSTGISTCVNWPVLPEKVYPRGSSIYIDLYDILRANTACTDGTIYDSFVGFQGVKRFPAGSFYQQAITPYRFKRVPHTYQFPLTIDWAHFDGTGSIASPHTFIQQILNNDFELFSIRISEKNSADPLLTNDFHFTLYDRGVHACSNVPVPQGYLNSARASAQTAPPYRTAFPAPVMVYPQGSQIQFDILSMLCSTVIPISYDITFVGCWRVPC